MLVSATVGPVPGGVAVPDLPALRTIVRSASEGERCSRVPCPACDGTGTLFGREQGRPAARTCRRCGGRGAIDGVPLLRLEGGVQRDFSELLGWARELRVPSVLQLLLREEGCADASGDGHAVVWCTANGSPLRRRGEYMVGRDAVGIGVEANGSIKGHVAFHVVREDATIGILGLWDLEVGESGSVSANWSERSSRGIVRRFGIAFPEAALRAAVERARCIGCRHAAHFGPPTGGPRRSRRAPSRGSRSSVTARPC